MDMNSSTINIFNKLYIFFDLLVFFKLINVIQSTVINFVMPRSNKLSFRRKNTI